MSDPAAAAVPSHLIFVFGTLKEGFPNFHINGGLRVPGAFVTAEPLPLFLVGKRHSPWLIDMPGEGCQVRGQVFEVGDAVLAAMDELERIHAPDGYRRVRIAVRADNMSCAAPIEVFAYLKDAQFLQGETIHAGPLAEYTLEHAARYRPRIRSA